MKAVSSRTNLLPEDVWNRFAGPLNLPLAAREEVASAIETYRSSLEDDTPTGSGQRRRFLAIQDQVRTLAELLSDLTFSEKARLLEKLGTVSSDEASPATWGALVQSGFAVLISRQVELSKAAGDASASVRNSKTGDSRKKANTDFLVACLDDILIRHTSKPLTTSNQPLTFAIRIFAIADDQRERTSERAIKDAVAFAVKHRSAVPRKLGRLYSDSSNMTVEYED